MAHPRNLTALNGWGLLFKMSDMRYLHTVIWKTPLKSEALFTLGGISYTNLNHTRMNSICSGAADFRLEVRKVISEKVLKWCRAAPRRSGLSNETSVWGGNAVAWQSRPSWTMLIRKKCSGPSFSPAFSAGSRQPRRAGKQDKWASPERHGNVRWQETKLGPGSDLQLIADLASWKPKSKFA